MHTSARSSNEFQKPEYMIPYHDGGPNNGHRAAFELMDEKLSWDFCEPKIWKHIVIAEKKLAGVTAALLYRYHFHAINLN